MCNTLSLSFPLAKFLQISARKSETNEVHLFTRQKKTSKKRRKRGYGREKLNSRERKYQMQRGSQWNERKDEESEVDSPCYIVELQFPVNHFVSHC